MAVEQRIEIRSPLKRREIRGDSSPTVNSRSHMPPGQVRLVNTPTVVTILRQADQALRTRQDRNLHRPWLYLCRCRPLASA